MSHPPQRLSDQMVYMLNRAIDAMFNHFEIWARERGVQPRKSYANSFKNDFEQLRPLVQKMMVDKSGNSLDAHKLAAMALLAVLSSRPMVVPMNGERHSVNEMVAFFLAVYIIREYQLRRICGNDLELRKKIETQITKLDTPKTIHSSQEVSGAIIDSLCFLSRLVRMFDASVANIVPILSVLMFYIDAYSYDSIQRIEATIT